MANVDIYFDSELGADEVLEFGFEHVALATGSTWRRDGIARQHVVPMPIEGGLDVYTPDDLMDGRLPKGRVMIFDDDHYYMGGVLAELLATSGAEVTLVTPAAYISEWTQNTLEQATIHKRLAEMGVTIHLNRGVDALLEGGVRTSCAYTGSAPRISRPTPSSWSPAGSRSIGSGRTSGLSRPPGPITASNP